MGEPLAKNLLQFVPFSSTVEATFWHKLCQLKLEIYALDDSAVDIEGYYVNHDPAGLPARFSVDYTSFAKSNNKTNTFVSRGHLVNKNTVEAFKELDKQSLINKIGNEIWEDITSGKALEDPNKLNRFLLLTFADLKKYHFYYWFAFPSLTFPEKLFYKKIEPLNEVLTTEEVAAFQSAVDRYAESGDISFFIAEKQNEGFVCHPLSKMVSLAEKDVWIAFSDPSTLPSNPGWPLRNLVALVSHFHKDLLTKKPILCWRDTTRDGVRNTGHSLLISIESVESAAADAVPRVVGWEKNERGKMGPRMVDLSATMDPTRLAEAAVDLNLKLMKWRLMPELDLGVIASTKCLLLGAGTLGCNVARNLMAWGVRDVTFVDDGRVAYSNPVRQSLFTFKDCQSGGSSKAQCAATALRNISPCVNSKAVSLRIPMPGHHVSDIVRSQVESDVALFARLIDEHDVVFLLTDTRESRWLPTMLAAFKGKLVINAALGFDSYLVMRHGHRAPWNDTQSVNKTEGILRGSIPGRDLGCYFCNDVVAPGDSTRDRTLDQQCTVTRPGVSMVASALAVELLVSVLQHPDKGNAAAEISKTDTQSVDSLLGMVPHSIRGFLSRFQQILPATEAFYNCTACSPLILDRYANEGFKFLLDVFNTPDLLEQVTGLADLHHQSGAIEVLEYTDEDED